jgi:hypothetical protein
MVKLNVKTEDKNIVTEVTETVAPVQGQRGVKKVLINPTAEQVEHLGKLTSTSAKIRYLAAEGYSSKENLYSGIATYLGVLTQHVRNVLTQPVKKA